MKILINNGIGNVDYTRYVVDGTLTTEDSINVPTLISFQLSPSDNTFVVPKRSAYVTIVSDVYAASGGYGSGKILGTGFVTSEPERTYLGLEQKLGAYGFKQYLYNVNVTSDEWNLNCRTVPYIPAFVNQTDSQILAAIANALMPGFFDTTTLMASGTLIPYFQYDPAQTWSDIAKTFADGNRYHYKVLNRIITYQPFGDRPLGIAFNDATMKDKALSPLEMKTGVITIPPVNDCIVIGDTEPQTNWDNYFVGDGFSSNFQLKHQVFDGTSTNLLEDDWTEASFTQGTWTVNDPRSVFALTDTNGNAVGALNIIQKGAIGVYTPQPSATFIQSQNGLELGGGINLQHGQVTFNDTASGGGGIIGGIYGVSTFIPGNCLAGFGITGQSAFSAHTINIVQIQQGNTNLVDLYVTGVLGPLQTGYVLQCAGFTTATFLNGTRQTIKTIVAIGDPTQNVFKLTCQGLQIYGAAFLVTNDVGTVQAFANDVLVTASGTAGIVIQPILNGQYVGPKVVTQVNHQYVLQTWVGANTQSRYTRPYRNLTQTQFYGNQNLAAQGAISFVVTDVNIGDYVIEQQNPLFGLFPGAPPPIVTKYTASNQTLPPFALYCLANAIDLNISINYTVLSLPPQGYLTVQSLTGASGSTLPWLPSQLTPPITYQLGFGMINQSAQIGQSGEVFQLQFYTDDIPAVGSRIRFQSWAAGQSIARVRDTVAVASEASISGDDGVRSAIMTNISPLPRTSDECEAAAGAAILDREYPQFQGSYTVMTVPFRYESLYSPSLYDYPKTGEFLFINSPLRGVTGQNFFVNTVRIQVVELRQEVMSIAVDYGPDLYLEKLLPAFLEREQNLLVPKQTSPAPNFITLGQVLNANLATLDNAQITSIVNSITGNYVSVDLGAPPVTACEVRNVDSGWGTSNQGRVGLFTTQTFTLPRTIRDQTWYLRTINGGKFSRFSKALRVVYPLVPSSPTLVQADTTKAVFDYSGDVRDIYGLELRAFPVSGVLFFVLPDTPTDSVGQFVRTAIPISRSAAGNVIAVYNPPSNSASFPYGTKLQVGDLILTKCPNDSSFAAVEIVSQAIASTASTPPFIPTTICLNGADAYFYRNLNSDHAFQLTSATAGGAYANYKGLTSLSFNSQNQDPNIQPMQVDNYDSNGVFHGRSIIWSGANSGYDMIVSGSLFVPTAGNHTFTINHDDAFLLGIQNATRVSGPLDNPNGQTVTAMRGYTIIAARNRTGYWPYETCILNFPTSGNYNFEIDFTQWKDNQTLVILADNANIFPTPPGIGQGGNPGTPWEFGWFDYGKQTPDVVGNVVFGVNNEVGTVQLFSRGPFVFVASGSISANYTGICTINTQTAHGFNIGDQIVIGCGWGTWPSNLPTPPQSGTVFCGQQTVTNVLSTTGFQFNIPRFTSQFNLGSGWEQQIAASGVSFQVIVGECAKMPSPLNLTLASGIILQRPVFSPSDLVIDFTNPDIAEVLEVLQALSPNNRVGSLKAFFFNTTWDYSAPTPIPAFDIPQIVNVVIDSNTQQALWQVQSGKPTGYRVEVIDPVSGITYNRFTVDNPNNPQALTQFKILLQDFSAPRNIIITPFDALGDGIAQIITNTTLFNVTGSQSPGSYSIGCTFNGSLPSNQVLVRIPFDVPVQFGLDFIPSQAYVDTPPNSTYVILINKLSASGTQGQIGTITFQPGIKTGVYKSTLSTLVNFNAGDVIKVVCPSVTDSLIADIGLTLSGIKN